MRALKFRNRLAIASVALGVATIATAGVSISNTAGASTKPSALVGNVKPISFPLTMSGISTIIAPEIWALQTGIWQRLGLDVNMTFQGAIANTEVAAGRDITTFYGTTGMFPGIEAGHAESAIFGGEVGNATLACDVPTSSSVTSIQGLSGGTVGIVGLTGAAYGAAVQISNYIVKHGGKALNIVGEPTQGGLASAVAVGALTAGCGSATFGATEAAGQTRNILQPTSALAKEIQGGPVLAIAQFGEKGLLARNRTAINRLVAGVRIAVAQLRKATDAQVAQVMATNSNFAPSVIATSGLLSEVQQIRPFWPANGGYISKTLWDQSLVNYSTWGLSVGGLPINMHSSLFSYKNAVDMSFWNASTPLVSAYYAKYGTKLDTTTVS